MSDTDSNTQDTQDTAAIATPDTGTAADEARDPVAEAEKWKGLARKHEAQAKANADAAQRLAEIEEAGKTEAQRLADQASQAESRATQAESTALRLEVALDNAPEGMPVAQVRKLAKRLAGRSREELEADAAELFADFAPDTTASPPGRPQERLRPGAVPSADPDEGDVTKLAAQVPRLY
jgi:hypothetical protein